MNRYTIHSLIGEGSFGRVYKAKVRDSGNVVAIKVISKRGRSHRELKNFRRECEIQATLKHPNIIAMLESFETKNDLVVVTEFALIDLHRYLLVKGPLTEEQARRMICHLVSALYYLHSNRILHRDLKPQNVLLNEELHAKLCDFGLARNMTTGTHVLTSIKGTPLYMAPELLAEQPYDHQADLWSLGCISYESIAGQPPFCTTSILHLVKLIKREEVKWPSFLSSDCCSFLQGLLEKDPSMRISWAQILCHPFVEGRLYINGIKAEDSPFINPQIRASKAKKDASSKGFSEALAAKLRDISLIGTRNDNATSSNDSMNAIPPSDIENIETDVEDKMYSHVVVPFADASAMRDIELHRMADRAIKAAAAAPIINSKTCFVSGNSNMILNHMNDNIPISQTPVNAPNSDGKYATNSSVKKSRSKDLEKRKLSQNLENFSVRLAHTSDAEGPRKTAITGATATTTSEPFIQKKEQKSSKDPKIAQNMQSTLKSSDDKRSMDNSPPCLLPGWDSCDESQSPPIENDEWLAFLNRTTQEVLDGELDALKQQNLVSIIVAPLRNSKATPKVVESVAQLLSLPFVLCEPDSVIESIKTVYVDVKLVPNLMYASKLLLCQKSTDESSTSLQHTFTNCTVRTLAELNSEEIRTTARLYELICHLVHLKQQCLSQFCDAVAILSANDLLINFLNHDYKNSQAIRISNCVLALFCCVLRELPENAELVEKIAFSTKLNLIWMLRQKNALLRTRLCMLFRLLARFSMRGLQSIWCMELKKAIESLTDDDSAEVREECESTLAELKQYSFYN